jgi:hypothetical protein
VTVRLLEVLTPTGACSSLVRVIGRVAEPDLPVVEDNSTGCHDAVVGPLVSGLGDDADPIFVRQACALRDGQTVDLINIPDDWCFLWTVLCPGGLRGRPLRDFFHSRQHALNMPHWKILLDRQTLRVGLFVRIIAAALPLPRRYLRQLILFALKLAHSDAERLHTWNIVALLIVVHVRTLRVHLFLRELPVLVALVRQLCYVS